MTTRARHVPWGRLDDLTIGRALRFSAPSRVLVAHDVADVADVLRAAERATDDGSWPLAS